MTLLVPRLTWVPTLHKEEPETQAHILVVSLKKQSQGTRKRDWRIKLGRRMDPYMIVTLKWTPLQTLGYPTERLSELSWGIEEDSAYQLTPFPIDKDLPTVDWFMHDSKKYLPGCHWAPYSSLSQKQQGILGSVLRTHLYEAGILPVSWPKGNFRADWYPILSFTPQHKQYANVLFLASSFCFFIDPWCQLIHQQLHQSP